MARSILLIVPYFDAAYGGPVTSVHALANSMTQKGLSTTVLSTTLGELGTMPPQFPTPRSYVLQTYPSLFPSIAWSHRFFFSPRLCIAAISLVRTADVVHMHDFFVFTHIFIVMLCKIFMKPFVLTPHGTLNLSENRGGVFLKSTFLFVCKGLYAHGASKIITLNKNERQAVVNQVSDTNKVVVIPNIVFPTSHNAKTTKFDFKKHKMILLFLGRIYGHKGVVELLRGFSVYCKENTDTTTQLLYAGPDAGALPELQEFTNKQNLTAQVHFLGTVIGADKDALLQHATIVCLLSRAEGLPTTIVEAASAGKPCLVTVSTNVPDLVASGGAIETRTDPDSVATAIQRIISSKQTQEKMGKAASTWYKTKHSPATIQDTYVALYNQLG